MGLKIIFMGTPEFSVPTLQYLAQAGADLAAVVTAPDRPQGRGYVRTPTPIKLAALKLGLPVHQPESVNDPAFLQVLAELKPDVGIVAAFGQLLKKPLLALPARGCFNLHASLLPQYRGAAPIQWAIARGETSTGVSVQQMAEKLDSGAVWVRKSISIGPDETAPELSLRLAAVGGLAVAETLEKLQTGNGQNGQVQDESQVTWAPSLTRDDGRLQWDWPAEDIHNRVRGFNPWPGTFAFACGERLKILTTSRAEAAAGIPAVSGTVLQVDPLRGWLVAAAAGTRIWIRRVQAAGKPVAEAAAYSCGHGFGPGNHLE